MLPIRCAYYARGQLTAKEMAAGYEKDGPVFTFAAMLNSRVHQQGDLRKLMEEDYLNLDDHMTRRWLKYDEQVRKAWPNSTPQVSEELAAETATRPIDAVQLSITDLQKGLMTLTSRVSQLRQLIIVGAAILAILSSRPHRLRVSQNCPRPA